MTVPERNRKTQANAGRRLADDAELANQLRCWIAGFHGTIKSCSEAELEQRVQSYLRQEDLYHEKVRFLLNILPGHIRYGLEIGSSAGGLSVALAQHGIAMHGIEPSRAGVEASTMRARRLGMENVRFLQGVGERIPFPDNIFDLVVSVAVLEHVQDVSLVVRETYRVLKPGGSAYFEVPNNLFPFEGHYKMVWLPMMPKPLAKLYVKARGARPEFLDHLHYMNRWIVMRHFRNAGFRNIQDVYGDFLAGKAAGAPWAVRSDRLSRMHWFALVIRHLFGSLPTAWFLNRAVFLLALKPHN